LQLVLNHIHGTTRNDVEYASPDNANRLWRHELDHDAESVLLLYWIPHSVYEPVFFLLSGLAAILLVDRHWLDESVTRNDPEYVPEAFQHLILQFILNNCDKKFMMEPVALQFRLVEVTRLNLSLPDTEDSQWNAENSRKGPSPQPSLQHTQVKRPSLAVGVTMVAMPNYCLLLND
jgi:hypothetical protein